MIKRLDSIAEKRGSLALVELRGMLGAETLDSHGLNQWLSDMKNRVEKHGDHDQSSHGAWATGDSGGEGGGSSRPRMADDVKPTSERSADAVKQAERLRRDAEAVEPAVTSLMEGIAKTIGADFAVLDGKSSLEQRLKSTDSLARKIDADAEKDHGGDREKAANAISDARSIHTQCR
jgi:hypothetical protein